MRRGKPKRLLFSTLKRTYGIMCFFCPSTVQLSHQHFEDFEKNAVSNFEEISSCMKKLIEKNLDFLVQFNETLVLFVGYFVHIQPFVNLKHD